MTWDPTHLRGCCSKTPYLSTTKHQPKFSYSPPPLSLRLLGKKISCCYGGATSAEVHCRLWLGSWWCTHSDHYFSQNLGGFVLVVSKLNPMTDLWINVYILPANWFENQQNVGKYRIHGSCGNQLVVNLVVWVRGWFGIQIRVPLSNNPMYWNWRLRKLGTNTPPKKKRAAESSPPICFFFLLGNWTKLLKNGDIPCMLFFCSRMVSISYISPWVAEG